MKDVNGWGKTKTTIFLLAVRGVSALLVVAIAFAIRRNIEHNAQLLSLRAHLPEYVTFTIPSTGSELPRESEVPTYRMPLAGKVIPVNAGTGQIDGLYERLPDRLRPREPADVRTVAMIDCAPSATRTTRAAAASGCTVAAFDLKSRALIGVHRFKDAPQSTGTSGQAKGADAAPSADVIAWLEQLQMRPTPDSASTATHRPCSGTLQDGRANSDGSFAEPTDVDGRASLSASVTGRRDPCR